MSSLLAANSVDAAALADELARFRVIDPARLSVLLSEFPGGNPAELAEYLVRSGVLNSYQAERILVGESRALALGPYRLTGLARFGTFGPVYTATRQDKPGDFHLSIFPLRSLWRARQAKQIARSLGTSLHPAVVPLLDADSANGFHYLVWPAVEGEPLSERLAATGPLSSREAIGVLVQIADALESCHARRITHGALTPLSILLNRKGLPRLMELGAGAILTANLADDESLLDTLSTSVAATAILKFSAPEFVLNPVGTPAADQYALGAIGYYILTGDPPFASASLTDWQAAKAEGRPYPLTEANPAIPAVLVGIIDRMLQSNPEDRFSGLAEVQDKLASMSGGAEYVTQQSEQSHLSSEENQPISQSLDGLRSSGNISWPVIDSGLSDLPTRDDSDASITFELPEPVPDFSLLPVPGSKNAFAENALSLPPDTPNNTGMDSVPYNNRTSQRNGGETGSPPDVNELPVSRPTTGKSLLQNAALPPVSPATRTSPTQSEDLHMAELKWPDPFDRAKDSARLGNAKAVMDPRKGVSTPVHYHTETAEEGDERVASTQSDSDDRAGDSVLWRKVKRSLLFWQTPQDVLRVSVFGPLSVTPGLAAKLSVFLHTPDTANSVRTLSRAFHHDAELIGTGSVTQEVTRDTELGVHLSVANAGISKSLLTMVWRGQPHRLVFDLHVPWESPGGAAPGLVSIGRNNVRIGKVEFWLTLLPRKG